MNPDAAYAPSSPPLVDTIFQRERLEKQYENLDQQHHAAALGMWVFLATEVMFFGALFLSVGVYHFLYPQAFETASEQLMWPIGAVNTFVLLLSSATIVLAVYYAERGSNRRVVILLGATALLGVCFLGLKAVEYYLDIREHLVPCQGFDARAWVEQHGLRPDQVPHVKLFLLLYWIMTGLHATHVIIGIGAVLVMLVWVWQGRFSPEYFTPLDVTALYWHFVDVVWIFLLPTLYLLGNNHW
jgi:cytochrome c oxidase subunit III